MTLLFGFLLLKQSFKVYYGRKLFNMLPFTPRMGKTGSKFTCLLPARDAYESARLPERAGTDFVFPLLKIRLIL